MLASSPSRLAKSEPLGHGVSHWPQQLAAAAAAALSGFESAGKALLWSLG